MKPLQAKYIQIKGLKSLDSRQVDFSHVWQQENKPAHLLTKYALGKDDFLVWLEENLFFLSEL